MQRPNHRGDTPHPGRFGRRRWLQIAGVGTGVVALQSLLDAGRAAADVTEPKLLLFVYLSGGWDQLLAFDPREYNKPEYQTNAPAAVSGTGIYPAYDMVQDPGVQDVLAQHPNTGGVRYRGSQSFGPAVPQELIDNHADDLAIVRGLMMDTVTHDVCIKYMLTGKLPRGTTPNGSSLPTMVASLEGNLSVLPNLAIGVEAYNEAEPAFASAIRVQTASDVANVLQPLGVPLAPASDRALQAFEEAQEEAERSCAFHDLNASGLGGLFRASRQQARAIVTSGLGSLFSYNLQTGDQALLSALDIGTNNDLIGPKGKAAVAALALQHGVSQAVAVELATGLDSHSAWDTDHAPILRPTLETLSNLISYLKATPYQGGDTPIWDYTTMVVLSEFARTPLVNSQNGRDHHLASSCLLAGPGIQGGIAVGATSDVDMAVQNMNPDSGAPDPDGMLVRPNDVHATLLASMGLSYEHLSSESPQIINAVLKDP